jgi:hypothetical protein
LPDPPQSLYPSFRRPLRFVAFNTTILAHCDAVWGGRQPSHLAYNMRRLAQLRRLNPCPA